MKIVVLQKRYSDSVSKSWIIFRHGIVAKLISAAEFFAAEDLALT